MVPRVESGGEDELREFRSRLESEAARIGRPLTGHELDGLSTHFRLLRQWGIRMNLTGLRDLDSIIKRHFLESIAAARLLVGEGRLIDLGSGNGFPAVPLAVLHSGVRLVLVEASEKKSSFLATVVMTIGLKSAQVVTRRACRRADLAEFFPARWITYRAVKVSGILDGATPPLLEHGGRLLAFVSAEEAGVLRRNPPKGLRAVDTMPLPSSPGDVVEVFAPIVSS